MLQAILFTVHTRRDGINCLYECKEILGGKKIRSPSRYRIY